jgi:dihydroneopterin aldolase / 2-amino-4-hydroxy-6-hydroxymethyldihydropteridine diphosphokinase
MRGHVVYLGLGSNLGERATNLEESLEKIAELASVEKKSGIYETEPWGLKEQPNFLNQVVKVKTRLEPLELLSSLKDIERTMGRKKSVKFGPRVIDLDILFYDDVIMKTETLTIPHPLMTKRAFVLVPLNEIAPNHLHPVEGKKIRELCERIEQHSVWRWEEQP